MSVLHWWLCRRYRKGNPFLKDGKRGEDGEKCRQADLGFSPWCITLLEGAKRGMRSCTEGWNSIPRQTPMQEAPEPGTWGKQQN